ncbi:FGGY carbohydrate kinase domain-containing protein isoform X2 [Protopterus annectens]|uniref:FGGY carbohydrate kinase domain-containing protein isoform X2 n=1 Tax=Protopterus annectens TaxID=7888 RepID=UPI001CF9F18A|nr:FGGY carbohydrate kinase domain-containing protein isoform X2 [Protopterus annectens]
MSNKMHELVHYYVGIDVGSASVRAALVDQFGTVLALAEQPIQIWEPQPHHYEQSSEDIWNACCIVCKTVVQGIDINRIRGLGFDATCSLVVLDDQFRPLAVNVEGEHNRNIVMWMDHRAFSQAERINQTKHSVLDSVGGTMSVEMQPPKLLWIKENLKETCWKKAAHFFDLPDFLSWKATSSLTRSLCTLVCKWTYKADSGWDDIFWELVGLEEFTKDGHAKIGNHVLSPGSPVEYGLSPEAAKDLGLSPGTAVAASLIDAHAGGLGLIGADVRGYSLPCEGQPITSRLALICGTSSCHMAISKTPIFVPGVWGPYYSAMVPGFWLNEGGQSASGKLMNHIVQGHAAFSELEVKAKSCGQNIYTYLNSHLELIKGSLPAGSLTVDLHVWPDFHGNRSPLADPALKGMLGTRHILETMQAAGHKITSLFMCGGLSKNPLFVQIHSDVTGMPVVLSREVESVLVGSAILGACASGDFSSIQEAMEKMVKLGNIFLPNMENKRFYDKKYQVFLKLVDHQREYKTIMEGP